jgi:hypothetical protein
LDVAVENLRTILVTSALGAGIDRDDVARWHGGTIRELDRYTSDWVRGQVAGASAAEPAEQTVDYTMGYRDGQLSAEQAEHYILLSDEVMEMLALTYLWKHEAREATWLPEKIRRAIEQGWFIQPKRSTSGIKEAETGNSKDSPVAAVA